MTRPDPIRLTRKEALRLIALAGSAAFVPGFLSAALAQAGEAGHVAGHDGGHDADAMGGMMMAPDASPATQAYMQAAMEMHAAMDIPYTGNADVDFVRGMIAHHQGAIDMAKVVIKYGQDPEVRQLAEGIVVAQEKEIGFMKAWLAAHS